METASSRGLDDIGLKIQFALAWQSYENRAKRDLNAMGHWRNVINMVDFYHSRYMAAKGGTAEETAFRNLQDLPWQVAPEVLARQLDSAFGDFHGFEKIAAQFD